METAKASKQLNLNSARGIEDNCELSMGLFRMPTWYANPFLMKYICARALRKSVFDQWNQNLKACLIGASSENGRHGRRCLIYPLHCEAVGLVGLKGIPDLLF